MKHSGFFVRPKGGWGKEIGPAHSVGRAVPQPVPHDREPGEDARLPGSPGAGIWAGGLPTGATAAALQVRYPALYIDLTPRDRFDAARYCDLWALWIRSYLDDFPKTASGERNRHVVLWPGCSYTERETHDSADA